MNAGVFDALGAMRALEAAGMNLGQAEAVVQTASAAAGTGRDDLATKVDLSRFAAKVDLEHFATKADLANAIAGLERRLACYGIAIAGLLFAALELF